MQVWFTESNIMLSMHLTYHYLHLVGQGVYTITNEDELMAFMTLPHKYHNCIVQSLVGNGSWSSRRRAGRFYHVGTVPNRKNHTFVSDLRVMVVGDEMGFRPIAIYGRRARRPLLRHLDDDPDGRCGGRVVHIDCIAIIYR